MKKFRYIIISKRAALCALIMSAVLVFGVLTAVSRDEILATNQSQKKLPIYCTQKQEKIISLSFDAAWGNKTKVHLLKPA